MTSLDNLSIGQSCKVIKIHGSSLVKRRIMDMGITKNAKISVIKFAPMGDPIELRVRGYDLSIRREDAKNIEVELIDG